MTREIFVDASAWIAMIDRDDKYHASAAQIYPRLLADYQWLVITNLVVAKVYVALQNDVGRHAAIAFLEDIRTSPRIERVLSTPVLEQEAETILRCHDDQDLSCTDAVSFARMKARGIKETFAFDKHFSTVGFYRIPALMRGG